MPAQALNDRTWSRLEPAAVLLRGMGDFVTTLMSDGGQAAIG